MPEIPEVIDNQQQDILRSILDAHGYDELTQTQYEAVYGGLMERENGILIAETGNGKTLVAEAAVKQTLHDGGRAAYLVPSTQLRTAKRDELRQWAEAEGWTIGTGGWGLRNADVTVCTFEQFYQLIIQDIGGARSVEQVVLDDFHEIYSSFRGPNIEKAITAIVEADIRILGISATLGNPIELAEWLGDATLIESSEKRSIPIVEHPTEAKRTPSRKAHIADFISESTDLAPFLVFNNTKSSTKARAEAVAEADPFDHNDTDHLAAIDAALATTTTDAHEELAALMERGVAYHHSGLEHGVREVVVDAIRAGDVTCLCSTSGLAYGFDAPIKTVIAADLKRYNGSIMEYIGCWEYLQWVGRAGRQGHGFDPGHAIPMWRDYDEADEQFQFEVPTGDKEIEDVTSHLDTDTQLRWLLLDLVATQWQTGDEIEMFLRNTLYWEQKRTSVSSWTTQYADPSEDLDATLGDLTEWLIENEFLTHSSITEEFSLPRLGSAAVEFNRNVWPTYSLPLVFSYYQYLARDLDAVQLLSHLCETFDITLTNTPDSGKLEAECREAGLDTDDPGLTAGVLAWYWCDGVDVDRIEVDLSFDPVGLNRTALDLSKLLTAGKYLFDAHTRQDPPVWWDTLTDQLRHGVPAADLALVDAVDGLGRKRGHDLREGVEEYLVENGVSLSDDETLVDLLFLARDNGASDLPRLICARVDGVGEVIARRIDEAVVEWDGGDRPAIHDPFAALSTISPRSPTLHTMNATLDKF